ncbi:MAG: cell division protein SepF [Candidatus Woesearchaeota archaeon]
MRKFFSQMKERFGSAPQPEDMEQEYVELDSTVKHVDDVDAKVVVRPFVINDFTDIKTILDALRDGYTIALINIKPLKEKDMIELKRAINKLKKTCDAVKGDIAGLGDDYIIVAPSFATIYRAKESQSKDFE